MTSRKSFSSEHESLCVLILLIISKYVYACLFVSVDALYVGACVDMQITPPLLSSPLVRLYEAADWGKDRGIMNKLILLSSLYRELFSLGCQIETGSRRS